MRDPKSEQIISQYEDEMFRGANPDLSDYLQQHPHDDGLLRELLNTDIELRIRKGESARVESYLQRFPKVSDHSQWIEELIATEYRTRKQFDPDFKFSEYVVRFPDNYRHLVDAQPNGSKSSNVHGTDTSDTFAARFSKQRLHEQGGLGNVWEANDSDFNRKVALKQIKAKFSKDTACQHRFLREAYLTAFLEHPGIVPVYGQGDYGDGEHYYAMRFVAGTSFKKTIFDVHLNTTQSFSRHSVALRRLLRHFIDCCNTISYAHANGIVHGDIKPGNIMIGDFGETVVVDWGLAWLSEWPDDSPMPNWRAELEKNLAQFDKADSIDDRAAGSPAFMSPETLPDSQFKASHLSDIYSLGATLLSLINNVQNPNAHASEAFKSPTKELKPLHAICKKAMRNDPSHRYQSAVEIVADVEYFLADQPVGAHKESVVERITRNSRRHRSVLNTALVAFVLLSALAVSSALWINNERSKAVIACNGELTLKIAAQEKTEQRSRLLEFLTSVLAGPGSCGFGGEITIPEAFERVKTFAESREDVLLLGFVSLISAKRNKAIQKYDESVKNYRRSLDLLSKALPNKDSIKVEAKLGLATALTKQALRFNADSQRRTSGLKLAEQHLQEVIATRDSDTESQRNRFLAMTGLPEIYLATDRKKEALKVLKEALEFGKQCYAPDAHHYCLARYLNANALRHNGQTKLAATELHQLIEDIENQGDLNGDMKVKAQFELASIAKRQRQYFKAAVLIESGLEAARKNNIFPTNSPYLREKELEMMAFQLHLSKAPAELKDRYEEIWKIELELGSAGGKGAVYAALSYANCLNHLKDVDSKRKCVDVCAQTIEAIELEGSLSRIPKKIFDKLHKHKAVNERLVGAGTD